VKGARSKKAAAYEAIKRRIIGNALKPGEPLNEAALVRDLGVSKTPIREALQQLEIEGFVEQVPGRGAFVTRISTDDVRELFEMREILECEAAARAAPKADPDRVAAVRRRFENCEAGDGRSSPRLHFKSGDAVHAFIFEILGNRRLTETYRRLQDHIARMRNHFGSRPAPERFEQSFREHVAILEALARRDPEAAEAAVRAHLRNATDFLRNLL